VSIPPPTLLELRRGSTLSSIVAAEISKLIMAGEFAGGARLNEAELAARFGISRGPVREALRTIERDGLVVGIANRGVFVRTVDEHAAAEIYDLRAALFSIASWIVAGDASAPLLHNLDSLVDTMAGAAAAADLETYYDGNLEFHGAIVRATGNTRLREQYAGLIQELHLFRRRSLVLPGRMVKSNDEHRALLDAIRLGEREHAANLARAHVLVSQPCRAGAVADAIPEN
jgi:DNA-binding GntR family transcriptional regulator